MKKSSTQLEQLYISLKKDYENLLEKNQNDLVKIRIREKTLNEKILQIQKQRQQQVQKLNTEIERLKKQLTNYQKWNNSLPKDINQDSQAFQINQKLAKITQQYKDLALRFKKLEQNQEILKMKLKDFDQKQQNLQDKVANQKSLLAKINEIEAQNTKFKQNMLQKEVEIANIKQEAQQAIAYIHENYRKEICQIQQNHLRFKQQLISAKTNFEKKLKSCQKCNDLQQQLELHKQMLKSVRTMLKFKQMELEKASK